MDTLICEENTVSGDKVAAISRAMPDEISLCDLAEFFRVFGDSTRIKILYALSQTELCVCELADILKMSQSAVSHQLQALRSHRLVRYRREGKSVIYSLDDEHIFSIIGQGIEHIKE